MNVELLPPDNSLPLALDSSGSSIALQARNDIEAVTAWLMARGSRTDNTFDAYRRESARLLLWLDEKQLGLRDLKVEHVHEFYQLLAAPPAKWLRPRKTSRGEQLAPTQVLTGPLAASSINFARTVLGQMCSYLQDAGYLQKNPFRLSARPVVVTKSVSARSLDLTSWDWLWHWIIRMPRETDRETAHAVRTRWLFALLYHAALRRDEVANGTMGDFVRTDGDWQLRVIGKGSVERMVTVNSVLLQELTIYRSWHELTPACPLPSETYPLILSVYKGHGQTSLTPRAIGKTISEVAAQAQATCPDEHMRQRISKLSTHWMRHTSATHRLKAGARLETVQDELGHKDPKTTRIYTKDIGEQRREDAELLARLQNDDI